MTLKRLRALVLVGLAIIVGWMVWILRHPPLMDLTLVFHPVVGSEPLAFHDPRYANPGGEGRFEIRDFQFYLSNIRLTAAEGEDAHVEPDSYHLVRFDGDDPGFRIVLRDVPRRDYRRLELGIGVDPAANKSLEQRGDLDPNGRMAWTWEVGYKFVLLEGTLLRGDARVPLVYHVGFDESYTPTAMELPDGLLAAESPRLDLRVDILRIFEGEAMIDMAALPTVKFDRGDAALIAGNLDGMIAPMREGR